MRIGISVFHACGSGLLQHLAQNYRLRCAFEPSKPHSSALLSHEHTSSTLTQQFRIRVRTLLGRYYPIVVHTDRTIRPFLYTELENVTDFWSHKAMAPLTSDLAFICTTSHTPACGATRLCWPSAAHEVVLPSSASPRPSSSPTKTILQIYFLSNRTKRLTPGGKGGRARALGFLAPWTRRRRRPHRPRRPRAGPIPPPAPSRFVRRPSFLLLFRLTRCAAVFGGSHGSTGQCWLKSGVVAPPIDRFRLVCEEIWR
jgi:hypothetical protein